MERFYRMFTVALLILALSLTACTGKKEPERSPEKEEKKEGKKEEQENPIVEGAGKMQARLRDLEEALEADNPPEVRRQARMLDDAWERFERKVDAKNPDLHRQIEASLHAVLARTQVIPLDTGTLRDEIERLDRKVDELKESRGERPNPQKLDTATGVAAMRQSLRELQEAVDRGDTAAMREKAEEVDRTWSKFKAEIREQGMEVYGRIEDPLHAILALVQESPVETQRLRVEMERLDSRLQQLAE